MRGSTMALGAAEAALLRVSKGDRRLLSALEEGVYLTSITARTIADLRQQAVADRLQLAEHFHATANKLLRTRPPQPRSAVSRYYYAMYHATRAIVFFVHGGDDHEKHSNLPGQMPPDFVDAAIWQNNLKDARGRRNEADYDPYPLAAASFLPAARDLQGRSADLLIAARAYLKTKGCAHL